jgi:hypothetical protein
VTEAGAGGVSASLAESRFTVSAVYGRYEYTNIIKMFQLSEDREVSGAARVDGPIVPVK